MIFMWNNIFNPDNAFFRGCAKLFDLVVLSILWALLCLPVVTAGPATVALYHTVVKCIRRGEPDPYRNFFSSLKQNFKTAALAGVVVILLGVFGLFSCNVLGIMAEAGVEAAFVVYIAYTLLLLVLLGVAAFLFPLLSRFTLRFSEVFVKGFVLGLRHLPSTLVVALLIYQVGAFTVRYWYPLLVAPALCALLASLFFERIFLKYTPDDEQPARNDDEPQKPWYLK